MVVKVVANKTDIVGRITCGTVETHPPKKKIGVLFTKE